MIAQEIKFSIIVPVFKVEKYIEQCLRSLSSQTYNNIEIILIDDGSPDKSGQLCDLFAQKYNNVMVIHQDNAGVSVARNSGIEQASGNYILFVDPDDWIEQDCCEKLANIVSTETYDIIFFMDKEINEFSDGECNRDIGEARVLTKEDIRQIQYNSIGMNYRLQGFHSGTPWGKLFRKDFIDKHKLRFTPGVVKAQDVLFDIQAYEVVDYAYYLNYTGYVYRKNEGSSNIRFNPKIVRGTYLLLEGLGNIADSHKDDVDYQKAMARTCLNRINFIERLYLFNKNSCLQKKEIISIYSDYLNHSVVKKYLPFYKSEAIDNIGNRSRHLLLRKNTLRLYYQLVRLRYHIK